MADNYLHIVSESDACVSVNGVFLGACHPSPVDFVTDEMSELYFSVIPLEKNCLGYSFRVKISGGKITADAALLSVIALPHNHFELRLKTYRHRSYVPPILLAELEFEKRRFTVFQDAFIQLIADNGTKTFNHVLPDGLTDIRVKAERSSDTIIFALTARCDKSQYLLILKDFGDGFKVVIDRFADKIDQRADKTMLLKARNDIASRALITCYSSKDFEPLEEYFVYDETAPVRTENKKDIPLAIFQAAKCGDYKEAEYYLTDGLKAVLYEKNNTKGGGAPLKDFFSEYLELRENLYYPNLENACILIRADLKADLLTFDFKGGKVDNIREINE